MEAQSVVPPVPEYPGVKCPTKATAPPKEGQTRFYIYRAANKISAGKPFGNNDAASLHGVMK